MKTITKILILVAGLAAAASSIVFAAAVNDSTKQARHPGVKALLRHRAVQKHVVRKLDLTSDQLAQLKAARSETRASIKGIRSDPALTRDEKKAKARDLLQAKRGGIRSTLTAEQKDTLTEMRQKLRERRRGKN